MDEIRKGWKLILFSILASAIVTAVSAFIKESTYEARKSAPLDYVNQQLDKKADKDFVNKELEKKVDKDVFNMLLQTLQDIKDEQQKINEYLRNNKVK